MGYSECWENLHKEDIKLEARGLQSEKRLLKELSESEMIKIMFEDFLKQKKPAEMVRLENKYLPENTVPKTVGIVFGCFIPLHDGHMDMIRKAYHENEHLILVVCGYDNDRGEDFIPFLRRVYLMKELFGNDPKITVAVVDDKKIGLTGTFSVEAWETWCKEAFRDTKRLLDEADTVTWYSGDEVYIQKISTIYPEHKYQLLDRTKNDISGTKIRKDIFKYWHRIHPLFQDYLLRSAGEVTYFGTDTDTSWDL